MFDKEVVVCAIASLSVVVLMIIFGVNLAVACLIFITYYGMMLSLKVDKILIKLKEKEDD